MIQKTDTHDVLLAIGHQITDFRDPNGAFLGTILGANAARELQAMVERSKQARRKKAEAGIATTHPPTGYISIPGGQWIKDPDPRVQDAIHLIFDKYLELGTVGAVVRFFRREVILLPGRMGPRGRPWRPATKWAVDGVLTHPAYAGIYQYGRTALVHPATTTHRSKRRELAKGEPTPVSIEDHHDSYVQPKVRDQILERLTAAKRTLQTPLGRGDTLFQGLLRCTHHNTLFHTAYPYRTRRGKGRVQRVGSYRCSSDQSGTVLVCAEMRAYRIDQLVESELLRTLQPPSLDVLEEATREALRTYHAQQRAREDELSRAQQAVDHAERAVDQTDPNHPRLRKRREEQLETAIEDHAQALASQQARPLHSPLILDDSTIAGLRSLLDDLPMLWRHPKITPDQRKVVVRQVIKIVHVTPGPHRWTLEVEWIGGARTSLEILTIQGFHAELQGLYAAGLTVPKITAHLKQHGRVHVLGSAAGKPYTETHVRRWIQRYGRQSLDGVQLWRPSRRRVPHRRETPIDPGSNQATPNHNPATSS